MTRDLLPFSLIEVDITIAIQADAYDPSHHDIMPSSLKLWNKTQGMLQLYDSDSAQTNGMLI